MTEHETVEKLSLRQVLTRFFSIVACGVGIAACLYSLGLQVQEVGNLISSICWFSGLGTVVAGIAGYVVTCSPRHNNHVRLAVCIIFAIAVGTFALELNFGWLQMIVSITLGTLLVQAIVLIVNHVVLKREDPLAL